MTLLPQTGKLANRVVVSRLEPCSIDVDALREQLARNDCGAVVVFEGRARASSQGREVVALDYEAFERIAVAQLADIAREVATVHDLGSVAAVHRVGRVAAGGIGVVVGAASPHSRDAFAAATTLLARVKTEVLIWKKEVFADGAEWVQAGRPLAPTTATRLRLADGSSADGAP